MDKLRELIDLVKLNKVKSIEIIDTRTKSNSKLMKFYRAILRGEIANDKQAQEYLYPGKSNKNAYYKLKHTLRERLYNTVFFIDTKSKKFSDIHKAKLNIQKMISLLNILITKGVKQNAIYMARRGLKIATEFEFTHERLFLARILRTHSATMLGDETEFKTYDLIVRECTDLLRSETIVEGYFFEILTLYVNDKSTKPYVYNLANEYLETLEAYLPPSPSANWIYYYTMIQVAKYMSINDYEKTLEVCDTVLEKLNALPFVHTKSISNLSSQAIACCIQLKLYEKGEQNIIRGLDVMQKGIYNWFKYKELHFTLCFHTKRYAKAWLIFEEVTKHPNFKKLLTNAQEIWKIYEAWLHFFYKANKINLLHNLDKLKAFRVSRYANEVPTYFKDKRGLNVPILISQIMLLLQQKKYGTVIDRMEAIAKYKDRYLDKTHNMRSQIFIRMLLAVVKGDFERDKVLAKTEKDWQLLQDIPLDLANQSYDIEILPYEDAWEVLLEQLE